MLFSELRSEWVGEGTLILVCGGVCGVGQVTGTTPMVTMDGCAGVMLYLSAQCLADDVSIVSSKCSEINVVLPAKVLPRPVWMDLIGGKSQTHCMVFQSRNLINHCSDSDLRIMGIYRYIGCGWARRQAAFARSAAFDACRDCRPLQWEATAAVAPRGRRPGRARGVWRLAPPGSL